jgi:hypothetical protein
MKGYFFYVSELRIFCFRCVLTIQSWHYIEVNCKYFFAIKLHLMFACHLEKIGSNLLLLLRLQHI